ncbi:MAG TPA: hypothetical protein VKA49_08565 [Flavitalea sp.]|nr:hypothetical protein [Flavitalea sp.]
MKYLTFIWALAALLLSNCKSSPDEDQQAVAVEEDTTERLDTVLSRRDIAYLNQLRSSTYAIAQNAAIDWSKFTMVASSQDDALVISPFRPDTSYYPTYGRLLRYSPDSSMFVDLDSYNMDFQKNKAGKLYPIEHGPDTEVSLVDLEKNQRSRLVFLGPGNGVEDGGWIDSNSVVLIGYYEKDTSKIKKAVIWRYHIPTKTFHIYESPDTSIVGQLLNWRKERFRQLQ